MRFCDYAWLWFSAGSGPLLCCSRSPQTSRPSSFCFKASFKAILPLGPPQYGPPGPSIAVQLLPTCLLLLSFFSVTSMKCLSFYLLCVQQMQTDSACAGLFRLSLPLALELGADSPLPLKITRAKTMCTFTQHLLPTPLSHCYHHFPKHLWSSSFPRVFSRCDLQSSHCCGKHGLPGRRPGGAALRPHLLSHQFCLPVTSGSSPNSNNRES